MGETLFTAEHAEHAEIAEKRNSCELLVGQMYETEKTKIPTFLGVLGGLCGEMAWLDYFNSCSF